jgi:hypothetical protein
MEHICASNNLIRAEITRSYKGRGCAGEDFSRGPALAVVTLVHA